MLYGYMCHLWYGVCCMVHTTLIVHMQCTTTGTHYMTSYGCMGYGIWVMGYAVPHHAMHGHYWVAPLQVVAIHTPYRYYGTVGPPSTVGAYPWMVWCALVQCTSGTSYGMV